MRSCNRRCLEFVRHSFVSEGLVVLVCDLRFKSGNHIEFLQLCSFETCQCAKHCVGDFGVLHGVHQCVLGAATRPLCSPYRRVRPTWHSPASLEFLGFRIPDPKPSDTGARGYLDSMDVDAVNSLSWQRKRVIESAWWVFKVWWSSQSTRLRCTHKHRQAIVWQRQTSHGPRARRAKARAKKRREHPKGTKISNQGVKGSHKGKTSKTGLSGLETGNQRQARTLRNRDTSTPLIPPGTMFGVLTNGMMAGVSMSGMTSGVLLDGTKVGNRHMTLPQSHLHMKVWMSVSPTVPTHMKG